MYVGVSVFLSAGETCMPLDVCEGQRTTLDASNHLSSCLRQGLLFATPYPRSTHQWASGSSVAISQLTVGMLGWQRGAITFTIRGFWRPRLEPPLMWSMPSESFATEPSPQPDSYLSITKDQFYYVHNKNKEKWKCRWRGLSGGAGMKAELCPNSRHAALLFVNGLACWGMNHQMTLMIA